ncbi:hypothetical protein M434DRAFT_35515 [Hypoxylon sp. CO27-5]|nr:hypothetical protein M434DRAFT_35515 [Hypoxylon sp. CO27-5]
MSFLTSRSDRLPLVPHFLAQEVPMAHLIDPQSQNVCPHCRIDYLEDREAYLEHVSTLMRCPCLQCDKIFLKDQLPGHLENIHMHCQKCAKTFEVEAELKTHRHNKHCRTYHFFCELCELGFPTRQKKDDHCTERHSVCKKCDKVFPGEKELLQHLTHPGAWDAGVEHGYCQSCKLDSDTQESLRSHYAASHNHLFCYACELHFHTPADLRVHFPERRGRAPPLLRDVQRGLRV